MAKIQAQLRDELGRIICSSSAKGLIFRISKALLHINKQKANPIAKRTKKGDETVYKKENVRDSSTWKMVSLTHREGNAH